MIGNVMPVLGAQPMQNGMMAISPSNNFALPSYPGTYSFGVVAIFSETGKERADTYSVELSLWKSDTKIATLAQPIIDGSQVENGPGHTLVFNLSFQNVRIDEAGSFEIHTTINGQPLNKCPIQFTLESQR
ncbi:hypothetical protein N4T21_12335 [Lacticaseibacillus paracasei]|uniref:hypothetical protein n=1 Tax=Lacticaseibacillus paracasei TaxID=1597 RepID=UPI0021AF1B09|nr:hypothetical protein [Lacticaseibacillus paracasei]UWY24065.1 hypothetical protein N4T21_12335 [Lacticaseibacillus paracasei]